MRVNCLAQEHNAVPQPGLEHGLFDLESSALTIRPPHLPLLQSSVCLKVSVLKRLLPKRSVCLRETCVYLSLLSAASLLQYSPSAHQSMPLFSPWWVLEAL